MKLPVKISPDPLIQSTLEIRFISDLKAEDVLGVFYPIFEKEFPKIKENKIPAELKKNLEFQYAPMYILSNDNYSLLISNNAVGFDNVNGYHLWPNYIEVIKRNLSLLNNKNFIKGIERIGLRYSNIFNGILDLNEILTIETCTPYKEYVGRTQLQNVLYTKDDVNLLLQIAQNATMKRHGATLNGAYVDIDASCKGQFRPIFDESLFSRIEILHKEGKQFFFSLIKEEYIKSLNPVYADL